MGGSHHRLQSTEPNRLYSDPTPRVSWISKPGCLLVHSPRQSRVFGCVMLVSTRRSQSQPILARGVSSTPHPRSYEAMRPWSQWNDHSHPPYRQRPRFDPMRFLRCHRRHHCRRRLRRRIVLSWIRGWWIVVAVSNHSR